MSRKYVNQFIKATFNSTIVPMTYSLLYNDLVIHMDEYGVVRIYLSLRKCPAVGFIRSVFLDFMIHGGSAVMALVELNGDAEHH